MIKVGDRIAAAVLSFKRAHLRIGVVEKIHPPVGMMRERYTLRDDEGEAHIVSAAKSVLIEADEHHTMDELYEYRLVYNAYAAMWFDTMHAKAVKSWRHDDGEPPFGEPLGTWFIVGVLTPDGWVTNHYKGEHWDMFHVEEHPRGPTWDGHTPAEGLRRLKRFLPEPLM